MSRVLPLIDLSFGRPRAMKRTSKDSFSCFVTLCRVLYQHANPIAFLIKFPIIHRLQEQFLDLGKVLEASDPYGMMSIVQRFWSAITT